MTIGNLDIGSPISLLLHLLSRSAAPSLQSPVSRLHHKTGIKARVLAVGEGVFMSCPSLLAVRFLSVEEKVYLVFITPDSHQLTPLRASQHTRGRDYSTSSHHAAQSAHELFAVARLGSSLDSGSHRQVCKIFTFPKRMVILKELPVGY